jgi:hypothetical protein
MTKERNDTSPGDGEMASENDLTKRERELLRSLPRELVPPDLVRERVRDELVRKGVLGPAVRKGDRPQVRPLRWLAAAAILAGVFLTGMFVGSSRFVVTESTAVAGPTASSPRSVDGASVQAAGTEYATTIKTLVEAPEVSPEALTAALATLRAAAEQMSRASEVDPDTAALLRRLREQDPSAEERHGVL